MGYSFYRYTRDDGSGNPIFKNRDGTQLIKVEKGTNETIISGSDATGDKLTLECNTVDARPRFYMVGNSHAYFDVPAGLGYFFQEGGTDFMKIYENTDTIIETRSNRHLYLSPNGTGLVKFGTYAAITTEVNAGFITIKDSGGTDRKICVVA